MKNLNNFVEDYIELLSKSILSTNINNLEKSCKEILRRIKNNKINYLKECNSSANYYYYEPNKYNIVEFKTKANALDSQSMEMLKLASDNNLIIIINPLTFFYQECVYENVGLLDWHLIHDLL